jgi:hypothetical protein
LPAVGFLQNRGNDNERSRHSTRQSKLVAEPGQSGSRTTQAQTLRRRPILSRGRSTTSGCESRTPQARPSAPSRSRGTCKRFGRSRPPGRSRFPHPPQTRSIFRQFLASPAANRPTSNPSRHGRRSTRTAVTSASSPGPIPVTLPIRTSHFSMERGARRLVQHRPAQSRGVAS